MSASSTKSRFVPARLLPALLILVGLGSCAWGTAELLGGVNRLAAAVLVLPRLPFLLGFDQSKVYLVLVQNRDELRATGGFVSGIGTLCLERGRLAALEIGDSYRVDDLSKDYPPPPQPLRRVMGGDYWLPRDANWEPDFPTAARQAQQLYHISTGQATDGVIAFDQRALRGLLASLDSPLQVEGFAEPITAENVETLLQRAWQPAAGQKLDNQWWLNRKNFMSVLGQSLLQRLKQTRDPRLIWKLLHQGLWLVESGHVLVYFNDPAAQSALRVADIENSLIPAAGDYLLWVDSNVGFNKTDAVVHREMVYHVDLTNPAQPTADLAMTYHHLGQPGVVCKHEASYGSGAYTDMQARCYWDYWRVYLPAGARLLKAQVKPVRAENLVTGIGWDGQVETSPAPAGMTAFAGLLLLPAGGREAVSLRVALPESVVQPLGRGGWRYALHVQKQAGLDALPLWVKVHIPPGYAVRGDAWNRTGSQEWSWRADVVRSLTLVVEVRRD